MRNYLLTYDTKENKYGSFGWFESEEELRQFVEDNDIEVIDAVHVTVMVELDIVQENKEPFMCDLCAMHEVTYEGEHCDDCDPNN